MGWGKPEDLGASADADRASRASHGAPAGLHHTATVPLREEHIGRATLYLGDCRDILPTLPKVDAVVTDPPYGMGAYAFDKDPIEALRLIVEIPTIVLFGYPETLVGWCARLHRSPDEWVTWWPTNGATKGRPGKGLQREVECIAIWGELLNRDALRTERKDCGVKTKYGTSDVKLLGDVWREPSPGIGFNSHLRQHPNEKPIEVMRRIVECYTPEGCAILDPFMGSGTTGVAAVQAGRDFIGVEIDHYHFETACKRIEDAQRQGDFFVDAAA